jgi:hypothetical protein
VTAISDPGRPSRRDRRRAQKLVDTAFAESRLTAADRALRTQRIQAAHTRGDLATITRDLVAPTPTNLGRALDAAGGTSRWRAGSGQRGTPSSMRSGSVGSMRRTLGTPMTVSPGAPTIDLSGIGRRIRLVVIIAIVGLFASCVLGLVAFIPAVITEVKRDISPAGSPGTTAPSQIPGDVVEADAASLHTAAGWTALVEAIKSESDTTEIYDLVAYPQYASVGLDGDGAVERRLYRNGAWQESFSVRTPIAGSLIDVAEIDPELIARLPAETARYVGIDNPTETYFLVNAYTGNPQIAVYVQSNGESRYRTYRLDGTPIS